MKAETYYQLEPDDRDYAKRLGESLNMINFVFTHHPELQRTPRIRTESGKTKKSKDHFNPHSKIFGGPFTAEDLLVWSEWVNKVIAAGYESIPLQHPAYRQSHQMALERFRQEADEFLHLFEETRTQSLVGTT